MPPPEALIDLQHEIIERFGGAHGLRDRGSLEQSLARPRQLEAYADVRSDAVALALNDCYLDAQESDASQVMFRLAAGEMTEGEFEAWVRSRTVTDGA